MNMSDVGRVELLSMQLLDSRKFMSYWVLETVMLSLTKMQVNMRKLHDCACDWGGGGEVDVCKGNRWLMGLQAVGYILWVHVGLLVVWGFLRFCYVVGRLKYKKNNTQNTELVLKLVGSPQANQFKEHKQKKFRLK